MTSQKNKAETLLLNRSKNKKCAKAYRKEQGAPTSKCDAEFQSSTIKDGVTENDLIISGTSVRTIRKSKANKNITSRETKNMKITYRSKITPESDGKSNFPSLNTVSDSGSVDTSEIGSRTSPLSNNIRTIKKNGVSELSNKNVLHVSDSKSQQMSFSMKPTPPVLCTSMPTSDMPMISTESNLDIPFSTFSLENILPETEINMIPRSSTSFEKVDINTNTNLDLFLPNSTDYDEQNIANTSLDCNINPMYCDIISLLGNKLNEIKCSKENFICKQLKIVPLNKPEQFNYDDANAFSIAIDLSTLKAANDYVMEISSGSVDIPELPSSDIIQEDLDTWQDSLMKSSSLTLGFENLTGDDLNELNSESAVSINYNPADIHPDFSNLNYYISDLNVSSNEINNENSQNILSENLDLLNDNIEESVKLCAKVKRRVKKRNWNSRKRKYENKINSLPKVNGVLDETLCYNCEENEVNENMGLVPNATCESLVLNSACPSTQSLAKKPKLKTVTEKDQKNCVIKSKCMNAAKDNLKCISQIPFEEALSFDNFDDSQQFSGEQAKHCLFENSTDTCVNNKISSSSSQLSVDCDTLYSDETCINPKLSQKSDNSEISETNLKTKCNISHKNEKAVKLNLTLEGKEIKLHEGLIVGLKKLDKDTLSKYCAISNIQEKKNKDNYPSTQQENNQIAVDVDISEVSYSNSKDTPVPFDDLENEVHLGSSKEVYKQKNLNLKEHLNSPKKSKSVDKSKSEENTSTDLEMSKLSKNNLKTNLKKNNTHEKLHISLTGNKENPLEVLRSKNEENVICELEISSNSEKQYKATNSSGTKIQSPKRKLNAKSELKLSNEIVSASEEKNCTGASELNKLPKKHSKSVDLSNVAISEYESSNVVEEQDFALLKSKKNKKSKSDLMFSKSPKRHLIVKLTHKNILLHEKERKRTSPTLKPQITNLELEAEKNSCFKDLESHDSVENHVQNSSSKLKTILHEEQVDISSKKTASVLKSNSDTSVSSNMASNTHQEYIKTTNTSKKTVISKKQKNNNDSPKISKVKSTKNVHDVSKIKLCRKKVHEPSNDFLTFSDTDKEESKNCKAKSVNKISENLQNSPEKCLNKINSRIILSKNCNSNSISQNFNEKEINIFPLNSDYNLRNEDTNKDRSMKPISKCSYKKTEEDDHCINHCEDLKEKSSNKSPCELAIDNSSNVQCSTSQTPDCENNIDGILSFKSVDKTSDTVTLIDDERLDFEPDLSYDLTIEPICENSSESLCCTSNEIDKVPVLDSDLTSLETQDSEEIFSESSIALKDNIFKESESALLINDCRLSTDPCNLTLNNISTVTKNSTVLLSEEDTDSDDDHSFKRTRCERRNNVNEASSSYVDLNNWKESDAVHVEALENESEQSAPNEICHKSIPSVTSSSKDESFKSTCEIQVLDCLNCDKINCLKLKESSGSVKHLTDVLLQIQDKCSNELFTEALEVANTYYDISSSDIKQCILKTLLVGIFSSISKFDKKDKSFLKVLDDILNLICHSDICNKKIASYFITKCCSYPDLNIYSMKMFHVCHKENIPLDTKAIKALSLILKSGEISFHVLLDFMNYTKLICNKNISKELLHVALDKCKTLALTFSDIHHMCSFLHSITSKEVEEHNLKDFILLCIKKNMWQHVVDMFIAWGTKSSLLFCIYSALTSDYKTMGKHFKKFANYVHEKEGSLSPEMKEKLTPELKIRFGQMGTVLMLNAFSKSHMDTALDVLNILHMYNVNYFELQPTTNSFLTHSSSEVENYNSKILPFSAVFTAIDICIHFKRPIDAFTIFQDFSWIVPDESLDEAVKTYAIKGKCQRLLKLVPLLNNEDSLNEGWEALENLLTIVKQDLTNEIFQENICDLVSIYNKYLVSLMNAEKTSSVYILYQYRLGQEKDKFNILLPDVLRGLIVTFFEDGRDKVANYLFLLGIMKKIYPLQKPKLEHFPWEITLMTHWTVTEIKIAVEWFIGVLFPLLMEKPKETNFEKWFSVKIIFDNKHHSSEGLKCLKDAISDPKYYVTKTKEALENMNPSLEVTEDMNENALYIVSNSLYNFWKSKCPDQELKFITMDMQYVKLCDKKFFFGSDKNYRAERESSIFVKKFLHETCNSSKSSDIIQESPNSIESSQSLSPSKWKNSSATDVYEIIHEIKANKSALSYAATPHEENPSGQNSVHNVLQSERSWLSDKAIFCGNEQIEFQHKVQDSINMQSPTISQNQLADVNNKSINYTLKSQQVTFSNVDQSITNSETTNKTSHFESTFTPTSMSSPCNSNKSPRASNAQCNSSASGFKNKELLPKNSSEKNGKLSNLGTSIHNLHTPSLSNESLNSFPDSPHSSKLKKKRMQIQRNASQLLISSKKLTVPLTVSRLKSRTISVNKTPIKAPEIVKIKKGKMLKVNNCSKKFKNLKICITPGDRTVSSPINSAPVESESESVTCNLAKSNFTDNQQRSLLSFHKDILVSDAPSNQTLPVVSQTVNDNVITMAGSDTSCTVSDSNATLVKLPVSKVKQHKQELDELPVSSQTTLKLTKSSTQSANSPPKSNIFKTVNLKNISNDKSISVSTSTSLLNCKAEQSKSKPVIKRNSTYSLGKTSTSATSNVNTASIIPSSGGSVLTFDKSKKITDVGQNFDANEVLTNCIPVIGNSSWNDEEFKKATQFLKAKVAFKNKTLSPGDQNKRVLSLLQTFIKNNEGITKLDKRTMKLLTEFANTHV